MKKLIPALALGLTLFSSLPTFAQTGPDYDMRFELTYTPLRVSTSKPSGVVHANLNAITFNGEGRIFKGILLGGTYTRGSDNKMDIVGVDDIGDPVTLNCRDPKFTDLKVYTKIPFNFQSVAEASRTGDGTPAMSPLYGYVGYKNTSFTSHWPNEAGHAGKANIENSSGFGFGLGAVCNWNPIGLYGQAVFYPCMITKNIGLDGEPDGKLKVWEFDLGLRSHFENSPIQAKIGYHWEQHSASNIKLRYDGFQIGASAAF
ncbi:hypothetical protein IJT10_08335 [bacterium]|nr:hypothetical protein [bacterium]